MFNETKDMKNSLFEVDVPHGAAAVEQWTVNHCTGKVSIEAEFGKECLHSRALDPSTLF